jgi:phenylacetate-CoA ligase
MIRYRTRDISRIIPELCPCGRTLRRIDRIRRRSDDMIIFHGVNIFPSQVEAALLQVDSSLPHYRIQLDSGASGLDVMTIEIEIRPEMVSDRIEDMEALRRKFASALDTILNIHAVVKLVPPNTLPRSEGKAKRVFDNRKQNLPA